MIDLHIPGMSRGHCAAAITCTVPVLDPEAKVQADLATHRVSMASARSAKALENAGYPPGSGTETS